MVAWWGERMAVPVAFVGREGELSRLLAALGGGARLVLVVGDAGVGKTRVVAEGMARAAGTVMVRGECLPLAETLPLLPVAAALDELARLDGGGLMTAALDAAPEYVRAEIGRLVPGLSPGGGPGLTGGRDDEWQRQRLFAAVAELLGTAASSAGCRIVLVVEDVHWADGATLDFVTFLTRAASWGAVSVVATYRADEVPVAGHVADWLAQARGAAGVEEIRLGPLSREEVAQQASALAGRPVPARVADELYARAEGNPFFTEQLVAAALAGGGGGELGIPARLPERLAELLAARAGRCAGDARAVLAVLAVAGRPLGEDLVGAAAGLSAEEVRSGLRELAAARLLADDTPGGAHRLRHVLLAEAVAGGLLPGDRAALHQRTARALAAAGDQTLAAEVAGHWQAAGNPTEELPARIAAARAAGRVCGLAEAAVHWRRAIELAPAEPGASAAGCDVPGLYLRAIDALEWSGDSTGAGEVAEEAYRRFAGDPDPATAAAVRHRAALYRAFDTTGAGLPLIEEALRLFEGTPPSAGHAEAWFDYAHIFLRSAQGRQDDILPALDRALAIAETANATGMISRILVSLTVDAFRRGQVGEGLALLDRGRALARAADDSMSLLILAVNESDALLKLAKFDAAAEVALGGLGPAQQAGLHSSRAAAVLAGNAAEALLARGRTADAAALIDPLTTGPPDRDHWLVHEARAEIDLLRGDIDAAAGRLRLVDAIPHRGNVDSVRESAQRAAELALWAGEPGDALVAVRRVLPLFQTAGLTILCGRLLTAGLRACADLAEQARARRDEPAAQHAAADSDDLASWAGQVDGGPFTDHAFVATIPAERAIWDAEQTRLAGPSDPEAWRTAAKAWEGLGCSHRAGYAWWRQAQAQLDAGHPAAMAAAALRAAAAAADGHRPLLTQIRLLAERARIPLQQPAAVTPPPSPPAEPRLPYGLTGRELAVLRLLAAGRSNTQIGAELYISPKTASVHVSSILRKLGVSGRVQAAALAERAGLLRPGPP
jgi:DNA-binding CsgD family transcriptional regulator